MKGYKTLYQAYKENKGNFTAPLTDLTKTLTMKKFTFFECKYSSRI